MSEWNSVVSVIGTLSGTAIGLLVGYWTSSRIEARKEKHEKEMEYRKELAKHMDDVIKPLFHLVGELWSNLAILRETIEGYSKVGTKEEWLAITAKANKDLLEFSISNESQIDLLLPHPLSTWVFVPIKERVKRIIAEISEGKKPLDEMLQIINAFMAYRENLKKLIGYETEVKLEVIYPFNSKK